MGEIAAHRSGLTLITGGARAGKTSLALQLARGHPGEVVYIATAEPRDDEMATRIARHRAERPPAWRTVEAPLDPGAAFAGLHPGTLVLLDCLTLWVSNLLLTGLPSEDWPAAAGEAEMARTLAEVTRFADALAGRGLPGIVVSNEVGLGIVPADPLSRLYRDTLGRANQALAARAAQVYLAVSGLALELRGAGAVPIRPSGTMGQGEGR